MAEETIVNNVASDVDDRMVENEQISKQDRVIDLVKIEELEQEKSGLMRENKDNCEKIRILSDVIEGFKRNQAEMKERLGKMQGEIDQYEEDKKSLQSVAARAFELETEVSRLQHDLISTMSESEETAGEFQKLKIEFNELQKKCLEKESKIEDLEKEKISLIQRIEKEVEEVKKLKSENENHVRDLKTREVKISQKENEILGLQTLGKEKETKKSSLEEALKLSGERFKEMEAEVKRLKTELEKSESTITELKDKNSEKETGNSKLLLPAIIVSTGTVFTAAAVVCYITCARRR